MSRLKIIAQGVFWILLYLAFTLLPLFIMLVGPERPAGRAFLREFSVALGFAGLSMMALQFALTARFKVVKSPYGSDIVYYFHRQISLAAFVMILAHPLLLIIERVDTLRLLNLFAAPWRARAGVTSVVALVLLIVFSLWRKQLKINYTKWRIWHGVLATLAVLLALVHVELVGHYVNTPWKRILWLVYALFWVGLLLYTRVIKPLWLMRKPYRVVDVRQERGNCWTLVVEPVSHRGLNFMSGQFAWLSIGDSPYAHHEHPFSFSSSAMQPERIAFTIKELGDFTATIKHVALGERVYIDGPFGAFSVDRHPHAKSYVFVAGGVGVTPIMSMLRTLADRRDTRPLLLIDANPDWESVVFREEIDELKNRLNLKVVHVLERPPEGWQGESGYVTMEILERYLPPVRQANEFEVFICGPKPMMDSVERSLAQMGIFPGDYHSERFDLV